MPHIDIKLYPGRDEDFKIKIAKSLQESLIESSGVWSKDDISVAIVELPKEEFDSKAKDGFKEGKLVLPSKHIQ